MADVSEASPWRAVRFERVMAAGRTRPLLLECARGAGARHERQRFVTKAIGLPEVHQFSLAHEFLGSRLAAACGLFAPSAVTVELLSAFLAAISEDLSQAGVHPRAGLAVGSWFVPDLIPFPIPPRLAQHELVQAAQVYAFDLLTQNPDRSRASPNCARVGAKVVPYDFETAFSFRFAIGQSEPWRVSELAFVRRHLFFDELAHSDINWEWLMAEMRTRVQTSVAHVCSTIPSEWREVGDDVYRHIAVVLEHWSQFTSEVIRPLRNVP